MKTKTAITALLFFFIFTASPKPSYGLFGVGDIVYDPASWIQTFIETVRDTAVDVKDLYYSAEQYTYQHKDTLATIQAALDDAEKLARLRNQIKKLSEANDLAGLANMLQEESIFLQELDLARLLKINWDDFAVDQFMKILEEMTKGEAIGIYISEVDSLFENKYEGWDAYKDHVYDTGMFMDKYKEWSLINRDTVKGALKAIGIQAEEIQDEKDLMDKLKKKSNNAEGNMQIIQVSNEIASVGVGQMQKLRQLIMAQTQMQAAFYASQQDKEDLLEAQRQSHEMREYEDHKKPILDNAEWQAGSFKMKVD